MMIDKKPIQDMPNKAFGDKHFASEFNTVKDFLLKTADAVNAVPEMIESDFKGVISPTDATPNTDGTYKPSVSSPDPGTNYPNAGNLKAKDGYNTTFYKKGTVWTKSEVKLTGNTAKQEFDPNNNNDPSTMKATADRYDKIFNPMLKGFIDQDLSATPSKIVTITQSSNIGGGHFLRTDDTYNTNTAYPEAGVVSKFPVGDAKRFRVKGIHNTNGALPFAAVTGIKKDGTPSVLVYWDASVSEEKILDVSDFVSVSVQTYSAGPWATLELLTYPLKYADVKDNFDKQLIVLDSFINPKVLSKTPIAMPQPGEKPDAILNAQWQQYPAVGYANGTIRFTDLPADAEYIVVNGDFTIAGGGVLWIGGFNDNPPAKYDTLVSGIVNKTEIIVPIDRTKYQGIVYTRFVGMHTFYSGKYLKGTIVKDSVLNAINNANSGSSSNSSIIDAASKWGVSPSKTGAENTIALNNAIIDGYTNKKRVILPGGIIPHNGFKYREGVELQGAGEANTILLSKTANIAIQDLDDGKQNRFLRGSISGLTLDGDNIGTLGFDLRNNQGFVLKNVKIQKFAKAGRLQGQLAHSMFNVVVMSCADGFEILTADQTYYGYMQSNLIHYVDVYISLVNGACFRIDRASNIKFISCNFENCGTTGDTNTGGVIATRLSPANEGIDLTFENCWTEGLRSVFVNVSNSKGCTTIRDTMVHLGGNGAGTNTGPAIINSGTKILLTGSTKLTGFTTGIVTNSNGETRADGFANSFTHSEQTGGTFKTVTYS